MDENIRTGDCGHPDMAWNQVLRPREPRSFIEDRLAALVDTASAPARLRVDVIHSVG
jgi:hypothetical protein